ncbi:hypothetical protein AB0465_14435 [Streptomyces griseoviridis]|uniref:hypothetical protein n=1 Tax=Streptomyces griseoviridis TaxID=45398 RepID=UPI0033DD037A
MKYIRKPAPEPGKTFEEQAVEAWDRADELDLTVIEIAGVKLLGDDDVIIPG